MSIYFSKEVNRVQFEVQQPDPNVNRITEAVSIIYYPYQSAAIPHVSLEVDGHCNSGLCCLMDSVKLSEKIQKAESGGKPFMRIGINVTNQQLEMLKNNVTKATCGINCVEWASRVLSQNTKVYIPFPLSLSPTLSVAYLCAMKALGSDSIASITFYSSLKKNSIYKAKVCLYTYLSVAREMLILYAIPKIAFENSQLVRAIRLWAGR